jgi:hypothetical protein
LKAGLHAVLLALVPGDSAAALSIVRRDYPERPVREFLTRHFAGSRSFSATGLDGKERWLTRRFRSALFKYFARRRDDKNGPPMVIDPFTGSMGAREYQIGDAKVRAEKAWVPVTCTDGANTWTITYLMRNDQERGDDRWRIDDIQDVRGMLLSEVLRG